MVDWLDPLLCTCGKAECHGSRRLLTSGSQEAERSNRKEPGLSIPLNMFPVTHFLQLGPPPTVLPSPNSLSKF
jgi:hypothetical protein